MKKRRKAGFPNTIKRNGKKYNRIIFAATRKEANELVRFYKTKEYKPYKSVRTIEGTAQNGKRGFMLYGWGLVKPWKN